MAQERREYVHYADDVEEDEFVARCRLAEAAFGGRWGWVDRILRKHAEWINQTNPLGAGGYTCLHQAAYYGAPYEVLEMLHEHGADHGLKAADGLTPLEVALHRGRGTCAEHLRALGPKPPAPRAIPVEFCDPILLDVFTDPVRTTAGQVYERSSIEAWFAAAHTTDPLTNLPLADLALTPVPELVEQIAAFRAAHPALFG
jgi:hypothetical protein